MIYCLIKVLIQKSIIRQILMGNNVDKNNSNSMLQDVQRLYTQVKKDSRGLVLVQKSTQTYHLLKQYAVGSEEICKAKVKQLEAYSKHSSQFILGISRVQSKMFNNLCSTSYKIYALFEYPEITLSDEINARKREGKHFQQFQLWSILHSCANALRLMKIPISFSPELVFINPQGHIKAINQELIDEQSRIVPTHGYFYAPQKLQSFNKLDTQKSLKKQAVFSLGMTLLSASSLQLVNSCYNLPQKIFDLNKFSILFQGLNQLYSQKLINILTQMTMIEPNKRISFEQLQRTIENIFNELELEQYEIPSQSLNKQNKKQTKSEEYCSSRFQEKKMDLPERSLKQLHQSVKGQKQDYSMTVRFGKIKDLKPIQIATKPILDQNHDKVLELTTPKNLPTKSNDGLYTDPKLLEMIRKDLQDIGKLKQSAFYETGKYAFVQPQQNIFSSVKPYECFQSNRQSLQNSSKPLQFLPYNDANNRAADFKELKTQGISQNNTSTTSRVPSQRGSFKVQGVPVFFKKNDLKDAVYTIETYEDGRHYEGMSVNGKKQGRGRLTFEDGAYYEGQFSQDKMNGRGTLYYSQNSPAYEGNWLNDRFHGFGTLYNQSPHMLQQGFDFRDFNFVDDYWIKFEGLFYMDNRNGQGKLHLSNGQCLSGTFKQDQIDGNCTFNCIDGTKIKGIWHKNILTQIIQQ